MIIETSKEQLLGLVETVIGVVENRNATTQPILTNILVTIQRGNITVSATDSEIEIKNQDLISTEHDVSFTLPGHKVHEIVKSFPDQASISLNILGESVELSSGSFKVTLYAFAASNFPNFDSIDHDASFKIPESTLVKLLKSVSFAMATQDARYYLNGILFDISEQKLKLVATDGHRMGVTEYPESIPVSENAQYIIPQKAIKEMLRLLKDTDRELEISLAKTRLSISLGDVTLTCQLIDGKYPDYEKAIPLQNPLEVIADKAQLRAALDRALILADDRRAAKLHFAPWKLTIESTNNEQDNGQEEVDINYDGESFETGFNLIYIKDVLKIIESDVVHLRFKDSTSTCLIQGSPVTGTYMVSPMRI